MDAREVVRSRYIAKKRASGVKRSPPRETLTHAEHVSSATQARSLGHLWPTRRSVISSDNQSSPPYSFIVTHTSYWPRSIPSEWPARAILYGIVPHDPWKLHIYTIISVLNDPMKLYGRTRTERAEKGQGGNSYIETIHTVEHDDKTREDVATTTIERVQDEYVIRHIPVRSDSIVTRIPIRKT